MREVRESYLCSSLDYFLRQASQGGNVTGKTTVTVTRNELVEEHQFISILKSLHGLKGEQVGGRRKRGHRLSLTRYSRRGVWGKSFC